MDLGLEIVLPCEADGRLIMQWRNDPETRFASFHQEAKNWESFEKEFYDHYFTYPEYPPLFAIVKGERVAFASIRPKAHPRDPLRTCCQVSLHVAPEQRGKGIGKAFLAKLIQWAQGIGVDDLMAEVLKDNGKSHQLFKSLRFTLLEETCKRVEQEIFCYSIYLRTLTPQKPLEKVFIIAEAGSNWVVGEDQEKNLNSALKMIEVAAEAGADAVKFQTFRPETLYGPNAGRVSYSELTMEELFNRLIMPKEMINTLASHAITCGIEWMSTPFSVEDFALVDPFVKRHKIASYELGHIHLIHLAARSGKPLILSTGAATEEEIAWAVDTFHKEGGRDLTLLQCTAAYPAPPESLHLATLAWMRKRYKVKVGLSDHSLDPVMAPIAATALGAAVIEKHFTLDRRLPGPDQVFAIEPHELKNFVEAIRFSEMMLGEGVKRTDRVEEELRSFALRGIQTLCPIDEGEVLNEGKNIAILRPGIQPRGVHPKYIVSIEGKKATRSLKAGEGLQHGDWTS